MSLVVVGRVCGTVFTATKADIQDGPTRWRVCPACRGADPPPDTDRTGPDNGGGSADLAFGPAERAADLAGSHARRARCGPRTQRALWIAGLFGSMLSCRLSEPKRASTI